MFKILDNLDPEYIAVAFDLKAPTFRHQMYSEYKGTRKGMPEELAMQMPLIKEVYNFFFIKIVFFCFATFSSRYSYSYIISCKLKSVSIA